MSICCTTFNHGNFIKYAIEGLLMQKTDFPFEILIHDDASTGRTTNFYTSVKDVTNTGRNTEI